MVEPDQHFPEEAIMDAGLASETKIQRQLKKSEVGSCLALMVVMSLGLFTERYHPFHLFISSVQLLQKRCSLKGDPFTQLVGTFSILQI